MSYWYLLLSSFIFFYLPLSTVKNDKLRFDKD